MNMKINDHPIRLIGDGSHAAVIRDLIDACVRLDRDSFKKLFINSGIIIAVGNNRDRKREALSRPEEVFISLIHPSAIVSFTVQIGFGTVIMAGSVVQARAKIGNHIILNTNCSVDHDSIIHDFAHISPGATICGGVEIGEGAWVGAGATVIQGMKVEPWTVVPAGSTVR